MKVNKTIIPLIWTNIDIKIYKFANIIAKILKRLPFIFLWKNSFFRDIILTIPVGGVIWLSAIKNYFM